MSDYQRIVSYLYEYHHGIKGSNVGFAKIEKRQNQLRVYFHVKTNDQALEYKIYFYHFHEGTMEGIFLDTIRRNDAIIEFKKNYPVIENFEEMDGFLIYHSNEHFFGSQWKELPIIIRSFKPLEIPDAKPEIVETIEKTEETKETKETEEIAETKTSGLSEYIEALQLEKDAKNIRHPDPVKGFDWKEYPTLPMPLSYSLDPSIKITLKDLDQIPDLDDNVKANGFLLLNYGNFGHLMLAKDADSGQRYLGIPGIFDNEKAFISRLFGFKTFITVPLKPHKTGNFGYFILPI
ncbi:DUF6128 domain-containing protein [Anaerostipes amylophilus]|uniref:DUF6128 domain-containing protein n=1 Tax=Anaerostipes amylophilus TaxID=2981779 RepID=A0ABV1IRF4_9FIRM